MSALALPLLQSAQHLLLVSLEALDEVPAPEDVRPGWIAMGSFFLLFAVTILLWMNMRKQIGKIKFDDGVDRSQPSLALPHRGAGLEVLLDRGRRRWVHTAPRVRGLGHAPRLTRGCAAPLRGGPGRPGPPGPGPRPAASWPTGWCRWPARRARARRCAR